MREIKFRAWDKLNKKMVDDADFIHINLNGEILIGDDWCGACDQNKYSTEEKGKENYLLMQYIGLKDKNGKEIYEGDIVRIYSEFFDINHDTGDILFDTGRLELENISSVYYNEDLCAFVIKIKNTNINELIFENYYYEVIGNIYENPELLGGIEND